MFGPSNAPKWPSKASTYSLYADPDSTFHVGADPDPTFHVGTDPNPQHCLYEAFIPPGENIQLLGGPWKNWAFAKEKKNIYWFFHFWIIKIGIRNTVFS
jgi:hypothetical protein